MDTSMNQGRWVLPVLLFAALAAAGCGSNAKTAVPVSTTTLSSAAPETKAVAPSIAVSDEIARTCELATSDLEQWPKFDFDRSELTARDHDILDALGKCLTTGPLQGRRIELIGRADPRGAPDYNLALGARRANVVARYLELLGVGGDRMHETSRGELDASGNDEASWQRDRRVDIVLAR